VSAPSTLVSYDFAVLRLVPHAHLGACIPIGVAVHSRTARFLALRTLEGAAALAALAPSVDAELLDRYLTSCRAMCAGEAWAGPVALAPTSERFHWLTAPRSDVLQCSPVHGGLCTSPQEALDRLYAAYVGAR
jgi:Protein of unknown function (DUF3037)